MTASRLDILIVENHPDTVKYLRLYLEQLGHAVRTAGTVEEALTRLQEASCDVLISDIGLPDATGWELMQRAGLSKEVYGIAMSGFGMGSDRSKSKAAGFRHHLLKPFTPDQLDEFLAEAQQERAAS